MAYTPGTLHIDARVLSGAVVPTGRYRITCEQADVIRDPSDLTKVFVGPLTGALAGGMASVSLPPSTAMDPNPVTYRVELWLDNFDDIEPITGVTITANGTTEYATLVSVVPVAGQPNFATLMASQVAAAAASAAAALASQAAAAASAAANGPGSDSWLKMVGGDFGFVFTVSPTMDATTGLPTAGAIKWPDGRAGVFAATVDTNYYTGFTVTYVPASGPTRTLAATGITYDSASGLPLGPTGLAVS